MFIPLSLATSIFGMNIQELNDSGQPIWVFVLTAAGILLLALCTWGMFYQWTKYIHAPHLTDSEMSAFAHEAEAQVYFWRRVALALWLLSHGHLVWSWRSGIFFSLFTKGKRGFKTTCDEFDKWCTCPKYIDLCELNYEDEACGISARSSTHSPHSPVAYVHAHANRKQTSRRAFSFANAI